MLNLSMSRALIINLENASNYIIDIKPIKDLHYESLINPGIVLFFNKEYDIIMFAESIICIEDLARDIEPEDGAYYYIIKNVDSPMTEEQLDYIYDGIGADRFSIHLINDKEKVKFNVCLN